MTENDPSAVPPVDETLPPIAPNDIPTEPENESAEPDVEPEGGWIQYTGEDGKTVRIPRSEYRE